MPGEPEALEGGGAGDAGQCAEPWAGVFVAFVAAVGAMRPRGGSLPPIMGGSFPPEGETTALAGFSAEMMPAAAALAVRAEPGAAGSVEAAVLVFRPGGIEARLKLAFIRGLAADAPSLLSPPSCQHQPPTS